MDLHGSVWEMITQPSLSAMNSHLPLNGIRIHLSGSIPRDASPSQQEGINTFVRLFARTVFREGGTLVHGSHPSFIQPLRAAAEPFIASGGSRDALELVRAANQDWDGHDLDAAARERWALVQPIPAAVGDPTKGIVPMRDWMAERCDLIVAVGGNWADVNWERAGVRAELVKTLERGKPAFVVGGFGGAARTFVDRDPTVASRLHNGWNADANRILADETDPDHLTASIIEQIQLLPLFRHGAPRGKLFRILALNGGGLRGAFTAAVLARWAENLGKDGGENLIKHFDLVAGTSTGAILAIGLGLGLPPKEILEFYRTEGPRIFPGRSQWRHWMGSKYDTPALADALKNAFGGRTLTDDSCCRLVIPTVRAQHGTAEVIVTAHAPERTGFRTFTAVEAALASAAAPTYFDAAQVAGEIASHQFLDGGVWANNPTLPAIAEAVGFLGVPLERIDVLSVGTLDSEVDFRPVINKGLLAYARRMPELFFTAQEDAAEKLAGRLLSEARHLRINQTTPFAIALDNAGALEDMARRGDIAGEESFAAVRTRFLDGFHAPDWRAAAPGKSHVAV